MTKTTTNSPGYGLKPHIAPGNFELDKIEWGGTDYFKHPNFIPFKNSTKKFKRELFEFYNQDDKQL